VLVVQEGNAARTLFRDSKIPVQAVVVGVVDRVDLERVNLDREARPQ
jgi:microcompartment protein CcmK/EutM